MGDRRRSFKPITTTTTTTTPQNQSANSLSSPQQIDIEIQDVLKSKDINVLTAFLSGRGYSVPSTPTELGLEMGKLESNDQLRKVYARLIELKNAAFGSNLKRKPLMPPAPQQMKYAAAYAAVKSMLDNNRPRGKITSEYFENLKKLSGPPNKIQALDALKAYYRAREEEEIKAQEAQAKMEQEHGRALEAMYRTTSPYLIKVAVKSVEVFVIDAWVPPSDRQMDMKGVERFMSVHPANPPGEPLFVPRCCIHLKDDVRSLTPAMKALLNKISSSWASEKLGLDQDLQNASDLLTRMSELTQTWGGNKPGPAEEEEEEEGANKAVLAELREVISQLILFVANHGQYGFVRLNVDHTGDVDAADFAAIHQLHGTWKQKKPISVVLPDSSNEYFNVNAYALIKFLPVRGKSRAKWAGDVEKSYELFNEGLVEVGEERIGTVQYLRHDAVVPLNTQDKRLDWKAITYEAVIIPYKTHLASPDETVLLAMLKNMDL